MWRMCDGFKYDVFLSHSSKDKKVVRNLAERLRTDGLRVWFDEWELKPGDNIPHNIEEGLEHSRVLVLCMSANAFGSDWAQLESGTFRFRDPLNKDRRFISLRLDDTPVKGSLAQFLYVDWRLKNCEQEYTKLLEACEPPARRTESQYERVSDTNIRSHVVRIGKARRNEWNRLRTDFEDEARRYYDVKMTVHFITRDKSTSHDSVHQPNHAINLWQYYGATDKIDQCYTEKLTKFGMSGAEISAFGIIIGEQTQLFCKMATRSGSLLPDEANHIIIEGIMEKFVQASTQGKPVFVANRNPLAKWLNLILVSTTASHPERFKDCTLSVDPFAASLTIFDYFQLDE